MEMHRHTSTTLRPAGELQVSNSHSGLDIKDANGDYLYLHLNSQQHQIRTNSSRPGRLLTLSGCCLVSRTSATLAVKEDKRSTLSILLRR
jgi:hypothetical protein